MSKHSTIISGGVHANAKGRARYLASRWLPAPVREFLERLGLFLGNPYHVAIVLRGPDGMIKETRAVYNAVTTAGKNGIADQILASPSLGKPTHMAVGTGTGGTTALNAEVDRNALTSKTRSTNVVTMVADWAAGDGTGALTEAGVLTAASSGDMWLYNTFSVVNKGANDTLTITWTLTIN